MKKTDKIVIGADGPPVFSPEVMREEVSKALRVSQYEEDTGRLHTNCDIREGIMWSRRKVISVCDRYSKKKKEEMMGKSDKRKAIERAKAEERRPVKIGRTSVMNAVGFFWFDYSKILVAKDMDDVGLFKGYGKKLRPMDEIERVFRDSSFLRSISWCGGGVIVRQGARQVTFDYGTDKVVLHLG